MQTLEDYSSRRYIKLLGGDTYGERAFGERKGRSISVAEEVRLEQAQEEGWQQRTASGASQPHDRMYEIYKE